MEGPVLIPLLLILCSLHSATLATVDYDLSPEDDYFYDWRERETMRYIPYFRRHGDLDGSVHLGRTRIGQGIFRFLAGGRDVELRCEFPTNELVSNIIWERVTDPVGRSFAYHHYFNDNGHQDLTGRGGYYGRTAVLQRAEGASLYLRDVLPADAGVYRCLASRRVPQSVGRWAQAIETIFQDVYFFPGNAAAILN